MSFTGGRRIMKSTARPRAPKPASLTLTKRVADLETNVSLLRESAARHERILESLRESHRTLISCNEAIVNDLRFLKDREEAIGGELRALVKEEMKVGWHETRTAIFEWMSTHLVCMKAGEHGCGGGT
jgi:hypothetical protein